MFHHYLAIDASGNKIGRCNLSAKQLTTHTGNLECFGYIVRSATTQSRITETEASLVAHVNHPQFPAIDLLTALDSLR